MPRLLGLSLHSGPAERVCGGHEKDSVHTIYCQQALGSLLWLVTHTRPDMVWAYCIVASMTARCPKAAAAYVRHMPRYFKTTREIGLIYARRRTPHVMGPMHVLAEASFAPTCSASRRAGMCFAGGNLVTWKSRRQPMITTSRAESELVAAVDAHLDARNAALLMAEMNQSGTVPFALVCGKTVALSMVGVAHKTQIHQRARISPGCGWTPKVVSTKSAKLTSDQMETQTG